MRVAVVTGASSGIGRSMAEEFAERGWAVAIGARRRDRLDDVAESIAARGGTAFAASLDVTDATSVQSFFDAAENALGVADLVVCNAGVAEPGRIVDLEPEAIERMIAVNLLGSTLVARRGVRALVEAGRSGDIVFITSHGVERPYPNLAMYGATKVAVEYMAGALRLELAGTGSRVMTIRLGPAESEFGTDFAPDRAIELMREWKRHGVHVEIGLSKLDADEVARVVAQTVELPRSVDPRLLQFGPTPPVRATGD